MGVDPLFIRQLNQFPQKFRRRSRPLALFFHECDYGGSDGMLVYRLLVLSFDIRLVRGQECLAVVSEGFGDGAPP